MCSIMLFANSGTFTSFLILILYISLSYLIAVARTFSIMLIEVDFQYYVNRSGNSGHPYLVADLRGYVFSFSLLSIMLAVVLSGMAFIYLRYPPSVLNLMRIFIMNGC